MVLPRSIGYLIVGVTLFLAARWALTYLLTPAFFRPGVPQVALVAAALIVLAGLRLHRAR